MFSKCFFHLMANRNIKIFSDYLKNPFSSHKCDGYGACSLCGCSGFSGSSQFCYRCGHHYDSHW